MRKLEEVSCLFYCGFCNMFKTRISKVRSIDAEVKDIIRPACKCEVCGNMMKRED